MQNLTTNSANRPKWNASADPNLADVCVKGQGSPALPSFGCIVFVPTGDGVTRKEYRISGTASPSDATIYRSTLLGIHAALDLLDREAYAAEIILRSDLTSIRLGLTGHLHNWKARGGLGTNKNPIKDWDLWDRLWERVHARAVTFRHPEKRAIMRAGALAYDVMPGQGTITSLNSAGAADVLVQ